MKDIQVLDNNVVRVSYQLYMLMGNILYGKNIIKWKFKCPRCGRIQTGEEFLKYLDYDSSQAKDVEAFMDTQTKCISRYTKENEGKCSWLIYGALDIHKMEYELPSQHTYFNGEFKQDSIPSVIVPVFEFADSPITEEDIVLIKIIENIISNNEDNITDKIFEEIKKTGNSKDAELWVNCLKELLKSRK